jgi:hypothetical protein
MESGAWRAFSRGDGMENMAPSESFGQAHQKKSILCFQHLLENITQSKIGCQTVNDIQNLAREN